MSGALERVQVFILAELPKLFFFLALAIKLRGQFGVNFWPMLFRLGHCPFSIPLVLEMYDPRLSHLNSWH